MKKSILALSVLINCLILSFAQNESSELSVPLTRKYDAVLRIEGNMNIVNEYEGKEYSKKIPVSEYGMITLSEAFNGYKALADLGDKAAMYAMGTYYRDKSRSDNHYELAVEYFSKLEKMDYAPGIHSLGYLYSQGYGVEKDIQKAISLYERAAQKKYASSFFNLGDLYLEGEEVQEDYDKGLAYINEGIKYKKPIEGKCVLAGTLIEYSKNHEDHLAAEKLLLEAEKMGYTEAVHLLAYCYSEKSLLPDDAKDAVYYRKTVELDAKEAAENREEDRELLQYLLVQEKNGDVDCLERIVELYAPYSRFSPDYKLYHEYILKGAEAGNLTCMVKLASAYNEGNYCESSKAKAAYWFEKCFDSIYGRRQALYFLNNIYIDSIIGLDEYLRSRIENFYYFGHSSYSDNFDGITFEAAFNYFKTLADTEKVPSYEEDEKRSAFYAVGFCYANGIGVEKDMEKALSYGYKEPEKELTTVEVYNARKQAYLEEEAEKKYDLVMKITSGEGDADTFYELSQIISRTESWKNLEKAYSFLEQAAYLGNDQALYELARWYMQGKYVKCSFEKAAELYAKAAEKGNSAAISEIARAYHWGLGVEQSCDKEIEWLLKRNPQSVYDNYLERYLLNDELPSTFKKTSNAYYSEPEEEFDDSDGELFDYAVTKNSKYSIPEDLTNPSEVLSSFLSSFLSGGDEWKNYVELDGYSEETQEAILSEFYEYKEELVDELKVFDWYFDEVDVDVPETDQFLYIKVFIYGEVDDDEENFSGFDEVEMYFSTETNSWYVETLPQ